MEPFAIVFMSVAMTAVIGLAAFCFLRILRNRHGDTGREK
jgi:hypothetical protein